MGGGSYWAGRAVACPLFGPCGLQLSPAHPLLRPEAICSRHSRLSLFFVLSITGRQFSEIHTTRWLLWCSVFIKFNFGRKPQTPLWAHNAPPDPLVSWGDTPSAIPPSPLRLPWPLASCSRRFPRCASSLTSNFPAHFLDASAAYGLSITEMVGSQSVS